MRIYPSPLLWLKKTPILQMAPACRTGNVSACAKFPMDAHTSSHHGLVDAITSDQSFTVAIAAEMLRNIGDTKGTFDQTAGVQIKSSFFSNGFAAIWTIFQDMRIVRFRSCCAISASV
jgi:hypothetical protein